jgi:two-component system, OmpR family, alkaline phosphatase synthesis response regulator PhoP
MHERILIVDDDVLLRRSLAFNLEQAGFHAGTAATAEDALAQAQIETPDLVLLDIGLPGMDGLDALRQLKARLGVPVIFLTARRRELDEVLGLELGADDYVTKPFDIDVLLAHIKAVLRRAAPVQAPSGTSKPLILNDLTINPAAHLVTIGGRPVELTPREFDLLHALALRPNQVLSTDELLNSVWGAEFAGQPQVVYVHIRWLREKLEDDPNHPSRLLTVRGVGYRLVNPD